MQHDLTLGVIPVHGGMINQAETHDHKGFFKRSLSWFWLLIPHIKLSQPPCRRDVTEGVEPTTETMGVNFEVSCTIEIES